MEAALHQLAGLDSQIGAPWPHQQRQFLQKCVQLLETIRVQRLQEEHYPSAQQFVNDCCADASALLELMEAWTCDWRVAYAAVSLAASGLYIHPDLGQVEVAGVRVKPLVNDLLDFICRRGFARGQLEAATLGVYECWDDLPHPSIALLQERPEINQMCRAILESFLEEPQCIHVGQSRNVHYIDV
jgi:hypothetical protein